MADHNLGRPQSSQVTSLLGNLAQTNPQAFRAALVALGPDADFSNIVQPIAAGSTPTPAPPSHPIQPYGGFTSAQPAPPASVPQQAHPAPAGHPISSAFARAPGIAATANNATSNVLGERRTLMNRNRPTVTVLPPRVATATLRQTSRRVRGDAIPMPTAAGVFAAPAPPPAAPTKLLKFMIHPSVCRCLFRILIRRMLGSH